MGKNTATATKNLQATLNDQCTTMSWCDHSPACTAEYDCDGSTIFTHVHHARNKSGEPVLDVLALVNVVDGETLPIELVIPLDQWEHCDGEGAFELAMAALSASHVYGLAKTALHGFFGVEVNPVK